VQRSTGSDVTVQICPINTILSNVVSAEPRFLLFVSEVKPFLAKLLGDFLSCVFCAFNELCFMPETLSYGNIIIGHT